ncbi:MAG: hypothetical protein HYU02_02105 [Thaumarchaeota archaeon]|nr:hypothetical protein [Nitrososphaerota archaeon]
MNKKTKLEIKDKIKITETDYRGMLASLLILGLVISVLLEKFEAAQIIGPLAGWATGWYFGSRDK